MNAQNQETYKTVATVIALIPEFHQVAVENAEGFHFAITQHTPGVDYAQLQLGQKLECLVTRKLPRVLDAKLLP